MPFQLLRRSLRTGRNIEFFTYQTYLYKRICYQGNISTRKYVRTSDPIKFYMAIEDNKLQFSEEVRLCYLLFSFALFCSLSINQF